MGYTLSLDETQRLIRFVICEYQPTVLDIQYVGQPINFAIEILWKINRLSDFAKNSPASWVVFIEYFASYGIMNLCIVRDNVNAIAI